MISLIFDLIKLLNFNQTLTGEYRTPIKLLSNKKRKQPKNIDYNQISIDNNKITLIQNENSILINNDLMDVFIKKASLYNVLGQFVSSWEIDTPNQQNIRIPIKKLNSGIYFVKTKNSKRENSKKTMMNELVLLRKY